MPLYEYYCHKCDAKFELLRPMSQSAAAVACPSGHEGAKRALSSFAAIGRAEGDFAGEGFGAPSLGGGCGGCAGGACACAAH